MDVRTSPAPIAALVETGCLPADPTDWVLASDEPFAAWAVLTGVLGGGDADPEVPAAHAATLRHPAVRTLLEDLPADLHRKLPGHHSPLFLPNRLNLLADMGVAHGDDPRLDGLLEALLGNRDTSGRFRAPWAASHGSEQEGLACDSNAIADVLGRFGLTDRRLKEATERLVSDLERTPQGLGWCCHPKHGGPMRDVTRAVDTCPQITLEGLRVIARLPDEARPRATIEAARTPLELWRRRTEERPYEFGHGYQFKTVKWPSVWYSALAVLDAVGRFPELWSGTESRPEDRRAIAEIAAVLIAHNVSADGRVTPVRTHHGYEAFSFGRKDSPSPFATAHVLLALSRVADLAGDIAGVDVDNLPASLGSERRRRRGEEEPATAAACPVPSARAHDSSRVLARVLARHHLDRPWEPRSPESITADIVGLLCNDPAAPYLSLAARFPGFVPAALDQALDHRRSLVRLRCMRGQMYAIRRNLVTIAHAASRRQVVRYARDFAQDRGVDAATYERLSARVLEAIAEEPLTRQQLREQLRPSVGLAAVITLMTAECLVLPSAPAGGRFGRQPTYVPFAAALPDLDLDTYDEDTARPLLLRAYVRCFGPVSRRDAAWWTGMDLKRVKRALEALEDELVEVSFDDSDDLWLMHAADAEELERAALVDMPSVALLPANDPLVIGYIDRSRFIDDIARRFAFDAAGNCAPVVLVNGRIAGVWDFAHIADETGKGNGTPTVRVFPVAPLDNVVVDRLAERARTVGRIRFGGAAEVEYVAGMRPLAVRPVGAFAHPLR